MQFDSRSSPRKSWMSQTDLFELLTTGYTFQELIEVIDKIDSCMGGASSN